MKIFQLMNVKIPIIVAIFSSPGRSPERAIVLPLASALVLALASAAAAVLAKSLTLKFFM